MDAASRTILFLAAQPQDMPRLRLDKIRDVEEGLRRSHHRDQFVLAQRWAVQPRDIQRAMLDVAPQIIHFSGNGDCDAGLVFENKGDRIQIELFRRWFIR